MALALYLDDCAFSHPLRERLLSAGHRVVVPADANLTGADDEEHLRYAATEGLILVTKNPNDFEALHEDWRADSQEHPGILGIYQDNDVRRDMLSSDIVRTVANVEVAYGSEGIRNQFLSLNQFRY